MKNEKKENRKWFSQKRWQPISRGIIHSAWFRDLVKLCLAPMMPIAIVQGVLERDIVALSGNILMIFMALLFLIRLIDVYTDESYRWEPFFEDRTELRYGFSPMGWILTAWYLLLFGCYIDRSPALFLDFAFYVTPVFLLAMVVMSVRKMMR